jgi:hypothetical protein
MLALMILWGPVVRVLTGATPSTALRPPGPASEIHRRADPVITRATERLTHAFNDEKAYLVDRRP